MKEAVIKTGGKQYLVKSGDVLDIEKIEKKKGTAFDFKDVLLVTDSKTTKIGKPKVSGAKVKAEVLEQFKDKKIHIIKYKPKTRYRRHTGHRQQLTKVKIGTITA